MYNEKLCDQVREGLRAIENTDNPVDTDKVRELVKYVFTGANVNGVADYYLSNGKGSWYATINKPTIPSSPVSDFYLVENICNDCKGEIKDGICFCNRDEPKLLVEKEEGKEKKKIIVVDIYYKNHDTVVLTNEKGDTYTCKYESLMNFLDATPSHPLPNEEDKLREVKSVEECLNENKPYGRNWEDFLLPDQMEFLYRAIHAYHAQFTQVKEAYTREDMAIRFAEWISKQYGTLRGKWVHYSVEILAHGSDEHFQRISDEHGKTTQELYTEFINTLKK